MLISSIQLNFLHLHIIPMTLYKDIMPHFHKFIHVYGLKLEYTVALLIKYDAQKFYIPQFLAPNLKILTMTLYGRKGAKLNINYYLLSIIITYYHAPLSMFIWKGRNIKWQLLLLLLSLSIIITYDILELGKVGSLAHFLLWWFS